MNRPWDGERLLSPAEGGWDDVVAPSAIAFADSYAKPHELDRDGIGRISQAFGLAARRALAAGFDIVELHSAHGYLLQRLSPLSNQRTDEYGGRFENRIRLLVETVEAVRREWPQDRPVFVRMSATDWAEGGWGIDESVALAHVLKQSGVDLIDVSSGGIIPAQKSRWDPATRYRLRSESGARAVLRPLASA